MKKRYLLYSIISIILFACQSIPEDEQDNKSIVIRESTDARTLNPVAAKDPFSIYISSQLFQPLLTIDLSTSKPIGVIAESLPQVVRDSTETMQLHYTIRKEARFDNGDPITAEDVLFSLKLNVAPSINNFGGKYYFKFIDEFLLDHDVPQKFTIVTNNSNIHNVFSSGDFSILPCKIYDSTELFSNYPLAKLMAMEEPDSLLLNYATIFNENMVSSSSESYNGSGAYRLKEWAKGERIILEKKADWWGNALSAENLFFKAFPSSIRYEIIPDHTTAIAALKNKQVDFVQSIPTRDFTQLDSLQFNLKSTLLAGYIYLGFNLNDSILSQLHIRQAIEACVPYQQIIDIIYQKKAIINRLPIAIQKEELRNKELTLQGYNLATAKSLLENNGWKDEDANGILDKTINGVKRELQLNYHYNAENNERKEIGLMLKAELKKIGIELVLNGVEWTQYLKLLRQNKLQIFINGTSTPPLTPNFTSSFHSSSANGGRNYANYQSKAVDTLIYQIKKEFDERKRRALIHEFQRVVNEDKPYLFLFSKHKNFAVSKSLTNGPVYAIRPYFWAPEFR